MNLSSLLLEYSDKIIQQLQTKFEKEGATLEESGNTFIDLRKSKNRYRQINVTYLNTHLNN